MTKIRLFLGKNRGSPKTQKDNRLIDSRYFSSYFWPKTTPKPLESHRPIIFKLSKNFRLQRNIQLFFEFIYQRITQNAKILNKPTVKRQTLVLGVILLTESKSALKTTLFQSIQSQSAKNQKKGLATRFNFDFFSIFPSFSMSFCSKLRAD